MKTILATCLLFLGASASQAGEVILPYPAFGPQVVANEQIGMEWWQWESHGDSRPREYPIKVVVFWDQTVEETAKRHPVDQGRLQDFRYVEYSRAIEHMARIVREFKKARLDASAIEKGLADLKKAHDGRLP